MAQSTLQLVCCTLCYVVLWIETRRGGRTDGKSPICQVHALADAPRFMTGGSVWEIVNDAVISRSNVFAKIFLVIDATFGCLELKIGSPEIAAAAAAAPLRLKLNRRSEGAVANVEVAGW